MFQLITRWFAKEPKAETPRARIEPIDWVQPVQGFTPPRTPQQDVRMLRPLFVPVNAAGYEQEWKTPMPYYTADLKPLRADLNHWVGIYSNAEAFVYRSSAGTNHYFTREGVVRADHDARSCCIEVKRVRTGETFHMSVFALTPCSMAEAANDTATDDARKKWDR